MDDNTAKDYNSTLLILNDKSLGTDAQDTVVLSNNVKRTLRIVDEITVAIAKDNMTDVVTGFGVLNEPFANCVSKIERNDDSISFLKDSEAHKNIFYSASCGHCSMTFWTRPGGPCGTKGYGCRSSI